MEWKDRQQIFIGLVRIGLKLVGLFYRRTFFVRTFFRGAIHRRYLALPAVSCRKLTVTSFSGKDRGKSEIDSHVLHADIAILDAASESLDSIPDPVDHTVDLRTGLLPKI